MQHGMRGPVVELLLLLLLGSTTDPSLSLTHRMQKCLASTIAHLQRTYSPSLSPSPSPSRPPNYKYHKPRLRVNPSTTISFSQVPTSLPPSTYRQGTFQQKKRQNAVGEVLEYPKRKNSPPLEKKLKLYVFLKILKICFVDRATYFRSAFKVSYRTVTVTVPRSKIGRNRCTNIDFDK